VKTANTLKCTFVGLVEIEPKRFLESGIKLVECPDCARMRSLSPRNGVLRFSSHDTRKSVPRKLINDGHRGKLPGKSLEERASEARVGIPSLAAKKAKSKRLS
jgi:hypothetical protein